ncbi:hypothetical protein C5F59_010920 [Streptomyces sp. QL37]|uniref:hypothetical protein n=1 Tax=Streptomyces sp. QL37 TaxID=2093747 RepID=UPI000CF23D4D|nr:hypothetical protein [Streptomyces sp. QL37]PPQ60054.1 hypothetical protein C5F59_27820 [Streptomyces sp. QL37]
MHRTGTTRRSALTATGALALGAVLTGCGDGADSRSASGGADAGTASLRAGTALRAAAARDSASLLSRYEQLAAAHPVTAPGLAPMGAAVREHLAALGGPPKAASGSPAPAPPAAPTDARAALRELAGEERRVADSRAAALLTAGPELARLLASIAAAGAAHAYLLTELAKEPPA